MENTYELREYSKAGYQVQRQRTQERYVKSEGGYAGNGQVQQSNRVQSGQSLNVRCCKTIPTTACICDGEHCRNAF